MGQLRLAQVLPGYNFEFEIALFSNGDLKKKKIGICLKRRQAGSAEKQHVLQMVSLHSLFCAYNMMANTSRKMLKPGLLY